MNSIKFYIFSLIIALPTLVRAYELTNLTRNDPYSFYTTRYRYEFLLNGLRYELFTGEQHPHESFRLTVTPFRESATDKVYVNRTSTTNENFNELPTIDTLPDTIRGCVTGRDFKKRKVPLGDIKGRLNMLALFYDQLKGCTSNNPSQTTLCPATQYFNFSAKPGATTNVFNNFINPESTTAFTTIFSPEEQETITTTCIPNFINPCQEDPCQRVGFFTIPLDYKKHGIRFDLDFAVCDDFDIELNMGFADIKVNNNQFSIVKNPSSEDTSKIIETSPRSNAKFIDLSCDAKTTSCTTGNTTCLLYGAECTCLDFLDLFLMRKVEEVANELCLDINDFCTTGIEDIRLGLHWEHVFPMCPDQHDHPLYLFTPFFLAEGSIAVADKVSNRKIFGLPLGNNGHSAIGFAAGFNFDYHNFFSVGVDAGLTHFFSRQYCDLPMPTAEQQAVFFPFSVDACIEPGNNWHASASLLYSEFYSGFSIFLQYLTINHAQDNVLITKDLRREIPILENKQEEFESLGGYDALPPFLPHIYERESKWDFQSLNFGFNYDFCENFGLGFLWETPISGRRTFSVTNLVFSFSAVF